MPRDRGRRTPTKPTTPTLSQLKATYAAKVAPPAPTRVSPRETARPVAAPAPARRTGSIKPYTSGAVIVAPRATTPAVPTPMRLPTRYDPATGGIYTGGLPQQRSQYQLPGQKQGPLWMQTGYDPSIGGISGPLMQEYMPQYWKATEQQRARERYMQGPGAPWTAQATAVGGLPTLPPWTGDGGGGGAGTGGYGGGGIGGYGGGGGYYNAPAVSSGSRVSTGRAVSRGLVNWRIGI